MNNLIPLTFKEKLNKVTTYLESNSVPLREGDITELHKGSLEVVGRTCKIKSEIRKLQSSGAIQFKLRLLPDVFHFGLLVSSYNTMLSAFGLKARLGSTKLVIKGPNGRINRYLAYMQMRFIKLRSSNPKGYWILYSMFVAKSSSFLTAILHGNNKNLYRLFSLGKMTRLTNKVNELRGAYICHRKLLSVKNPTLFQQHYIRMVRTYLPKGESWRPLGVPNLA